MRSSRLSLTLQTINDSPPIQRGRGFGLSVWEDVQQVALIVGYAAESSPSRASLTGLDGINFFNAAMLAGFGPYVAVYLAEQKWTQENIGFVLTASGLAGLVALMPGGELLDAVRSKRALVALGASVVAVTALVIGIWPNFPLVFTALVLHGTTGAFLGPAIAAISLGVVGHLALAEQLGRNQRFASAGSLIATGLMGLIGYLLSYQAMFLIAAALVLPLLVALAAIRPADIDFARSCGAPRLHAATQRARTTHRSLWKSPGVLTFAACLFLFQLANAALLPVVGAALVYDGESRSSLIVAALIILPQIVVCLLGSLGWTAGAKLGSPAAAPHRVRGSTDPCAAVCLDRRSIVSCRLSTA